MKVWAHNVVPLAAEATKAAAVATAAVPFVPLVPRNVVRDTAFVVNANTCLQRLKAGGKLEIRTVVAEEFKDTKFRIAQNGYERDLNFVQWIQYLHEHNHYNVRLSRRPAEDSRSPNSHCIVTFPATERFAYKPWDREHVRTLFQPHKEVLRWDMLRSNSIISSEQGSSDDNNNTHNAVLEGVVPTEPFINLLFVKPLGQVREHLLDAVMRARDWSLKNKDTYYRWLNDGERILFTAPIEHVMHGYAPQWLKYIPPESYGNRESCVAVQVMCATFSSWVFGPNGWDVTSNPTEEATYITKQLRDALRDGYVCSANRVRDTTLTTD